MNILFNIMDCVGQDESSVAPTHLKLSIDWRCKLENQQKVGFFISLFLDTMDQGRLEMMRDQLFLIDGDPWHEQGSIDPVSPNASSRVNILTLAWNLEMNLIPAETPDSYYLQISGPIDMRWMIGELDLDPST